MRVSPSGRRWIAVGEQSMTIGADLAVRFLRADYGLEWRWGLGWRPGPGDTLQTIGGGEGIGLLGIQPEPFFRVLLTQEAFVEQTGIELPIFRSGLWDEANRRFVNYSLPRGSMWWSEHDLGDGWIWSVDLEGTVEVLAAFPQLERGHRGAFLGSPVLGPRGHFYFIVHWAFDRPPTRRIFAVSPQGEVEQIVGPGVLAANCGAPSFLDSQTTDSDGSLLFRACGPMGDRDRPPYPCRYCRYTPEDGITPWHGPDALVPLFADEHPRLLPDPLGGYWIVGTPLGWGGEPSIFHFTPPAELRLDISWFELDLGVDWAEPDINGLAVREEDGSMVFLEADRPWPGGGGAIPSDRTWEEGWDQLPPGLSHAPVQGIPTHIASVDDLHSEVEEGFWWWGFHSPLALPDGAVLAIADREVYALAGDARDAIIRIEPDGHGAIIGDGEPFPWAGLDLSGHFLDLTLSPEGNLLVLDRHGVFEIPPEGGEPIVRLGYQGFLDVFGRDDFPRSFPNPTSFAVAADGTVLVYERLEGALVRIPPDGPAQAIPVGADAPALEDAFLDAAGNLWGLADARLVAISPDGEAFSPVPVDDILAVTEQDDLRPWAMAKGPGDAAVIFDHVSRRLVRICPAP